MFQIYLEPIQQACEELERQQRSCSQVRDQVDSALHGLESMKGFDAVIQRLRTQRSHLDEEIHQHSIMMRSLGNLLLLYRTTENRILDAGEEGIAVNRTVLTGMVHLSSEAIKGWNVHLY